jgi:hypothetical protein
MTVCPVCGVCFLAKRRHHRVTRSDRCRQQLHRIRRDAPEPAAAPPPQAPDASLVRFSRPDSAPRNRDQPLAPFPGNGRAMAARLRLVPAGHRPGRMRPAHRCAVALRRPGSAPRVRRLARWRVRRVALGAQPDHPPPELGR